MQCFVWLSYCVVFIIVCTFIKEFINIYQKIKNSYSSLEQSTIGMHGSAPIQLNLQSILWYHSLPNKTFFPNSPLSSEKNWKIHQTCVNAEHSTYFTAFSSRASFSPCSNVMGFCLFLANFSIVVASSRKSTCVPTSKKGVFWQWCVISGTHYIKKKRKIINFHMN